MNYFLTTIIFFVLLFQDGTTKRECSRLISEGVAAMSAKEYSKSLELLTRAETIAQENNWPEQHFLAINNIGANYYYLFDFGEALDNYLEAYTIAIKKLDAAYEMTVLNNIAILYSEEEKYDKALTYFHKAYELAKKNNKPIKVGMYAVNLGIVYNEKGQLERGREILKKTIPLLKENPEVLLQAKIGLAQNYFKNQAFNKAQKLIESLQFKTGEHTEYEVAALLLLSKIQQHGHQLEQAISYAEKALSKSRNPENKVEIFDLLSSLYYKENAYGKALNAKDSIIFIKENLSRIKNNRLFETNKVKFEIKNYQQELKINQQKLISERRIYYIIIAASVLIIVLIAWALRNSYIKIKQRKIIHRRSEEVMTLDLAKRESDNLLLEKQLKEKEALSLLEQERLKNEIDSRNRKLSAKALYLSHRNKLIASIVDDLETSATPKNGSSSLGQHIKTLKNLLKNDKEWEDFVRHFEEVNQGFLDNLKEKYPALNANDLRFISYLYMNLNLKEIAAIFNITPEASRKRKERIAKKMNLADGSLLYAHISSF